jgi:hypothetical protein
LFRFHVENEIGVRSFQNVLAGSEVAENRVFVGQAGGEVVSRLMKGLYLDGMTRSAGLVASISVSRLSEKGQKEKERDCENAREHRAKRTADLSTPLRSGRDDKFVREWSGWQRGGWCFHGKWFAGRNVFFIPLGGSQARHFSGRDDKFVVELPVSQQSCHLDRSVPGFPATLH